MEWFNLGNTTHTHKQACIHHLSYVHQVFLYFLGPKEDVFLCTYSQNEAMEDALVGLPVIACIPCHSEEDMKTSFINFNTSLSPFLTDDDIYCAQPTENFCLFQSLFYIFPLSVTISVIGIFDRNKK